MLVVQVASVFYTSCAMPAVTAFLIYLFNARVATVATMVWKGKKRRNLVKRNKTGWLDQRMKEKSVGFWVLDGQDVLCGNWWLVKDQGCLWWGCMNIPQSIAFPVHQVIHDVTWPLDSRMSWCCMRVHLWSLKGDVVQLQLHHSVG